jgi:hypothetical protein
VPVEVVFIVSSILLVARLGDGQQQPIAATYIKTRNAPIGWIEYFGLHRAGSGSVSDPTTGRLCAQASAW